MENLPLIPIEDSVVFPGMTATSRSTWAMRSACSWCRATARSSARSGPSPGGRPHEDPRGIEAVAFEASIEASRAPRSPALTDGFGWR